MGSAAVVREEERAARERLRRVEKMQRAAGRAREKAQSSAIADAIRETANVKGCKCGLRRGMSHADIRELGAGCSAPRWVCPRLDAVRRRLGR